MFFLVTLNLVEIFALDSSSGSYLILVLRYSLELRCSRRRQTLEPSRNPASHEASYDVCTLKSSCNAAQH